MAKRAWRGKERSNLDKGVGFVIVNFQDGGHISATVTIIWCAEDCHHFLFLKYLGLKTVDFRIKDKLAREKQI